MDIQQMEKVKDVHAVDLMKKANVISVGVGYKFRAGVSSEQLAVVVGVSEKVPTSELKAADIIPMFLGAARTDVVEVEVIKALPERTDKWRPAPGGVSIGHPSVTAGTLGCLVQNDDGVYILSNYHVLVGDGGTPGDPIYQPGVYDGGGPDDTIGTLDKHVPVHFIVEVPGCGVATGAARLLNAMAQAVGSHHRLGAYRVQQETNLVDAALCRPDDVSDVLTSILEIGTPTGAGEAQLGMAIQKSGRTTGLTQDVVLQVAVTVQVQYGAGKIAVFEDQVMAGPMSAGGDSGSAVLDLDGHVVGLLFAGSEQVTIFNRWANVAQALDVEIITG